MDQNLFDTQMPVTPVWQKKRKPLTFASILIPYSLDKHRAFTYRHCQFSLLRLEREVSTPESTDVRLSFTHDTRPMQIHLASVVSLLKGSMVRW